MTPPLMSVEEEGQSGVSVLASSPLNGPGLRERNYLGLSDCSSVDSSSTPLSDGNRSNLNFKATELRLGLPGSQSPERESDISSLGPGKFDAKPLFPLMPCKNVISGNKRGFANTMDGFSEAKGLAYAENNWMFHNESESSQAVGQGRFAGNTGVASLRQSEAQSNIMEIRSVQGHATSKANTNQNGACNNKSSTPASKAQIVGWPPVRSFRKNTLATTSKNNDEVDGKPGPGALFIKVSMDGAPYLRKVDLRSYSSYQEVSSALEKMFSCFTIGQCGSHGAPGKGKLSESKLRDLLHGSEYVLTYEDKDGDWMLVGDVPWEMFTESCKKLKIMKGSEAIGLAPRDMEKPKMRT